MNLSKKTTTNKGSSPLFFVFDIFWIYKNNQKSKKKLTAQKIFFRANPLQKATNPRTMSELIAMPVIDAHFWVVRDGEIIDPTFSKQDSFISQFNGTTTEKAYHEAPPLVQAVYVAMLKKTVAYELHKNKMISNGVFVTSDLKKPISESEMIHMIEEYEPRFGRCHLNAFTEACKRGGKIVFGSMGYKKKNGDVWWEYGGKDWDTVAQFRK
jgi:hypothetical protein